MFFLVFYHEYDYRSGSFFPLVSKLLRGPYSTKSSARRGLSRFLSHESKVFQSFIISSYVGPYSELSLIDYPDPVF